jgi:hypothetical protein
MTGNVLNIPVSRSSLVVVDDDDDDDWFLVKELVTFCCCRNCSSAEAKPSLSNRSTELRLPKHLFRSTEVVIKEPIFG